MARTERDLFKSPEERRKALSETVEMLLKGESLRDIETKMVDRYDLPNDYVRSNLIVVSRNETARVTAQQSELIVPMHIELYEEIYKYFDSVDYVHGKLKALKLKEKLLGLHKVENTIEINNKRTTIIEKDVVYNTNKLTSQEKGRLSYLLDKAKK